MINIVGAGSLGSFSAFLLAKMTAVLRCQIRVTDFDKVELHNVQNQLYKEAHVGMLKVQALKEIVSETVGVDLLIENKEIGENSDLRGIVIVLVDNMKTRVNIFNYCKFNPAVRYFIDARTGENEALVFALNPCDPDWVRRYESMLFLDSQAQAPVCARPDTVPTLWFVAAIIAKLVLNFVSKKVFTNEFYQATINLNPWPSVVSDVQEDM